MATQTSLVAQQVRIRQWAEQIRNCQNRPKGMDVETWSYCHNSQSHFSIFQSADPYRHNLQTNSLC